MQRRLAAFGVLLVICLLVGRLAGVRLAQRLGSWVEDRLLARFPPYGVLKSLASQLSGVDAERLQPALMTVASDTRMLVAIVERLSDGRVTVFVPMAPTPGLGHLQIVDAAKLEPLACRMCPTPWAGR